MDKIPKVGVEAVDQTVVDLGDFYLCGVCGKLDQMDKTRQELIATYELRYGKEYSPHEVILTCTVCDQLLSAVRFNGGKSCPKSPS